MGCCRGRRGFSPPPTPLRRNQGSAHATPPLRPGLGPRVPGQGRAGQQLQAKQRHGRAPSLPAARPCSRAASQQGNGRIRNSSQPASQPASSRVCRRPGGGGAGGGGRGAGLLQRAATLAFTWATTRRGPSPAGRPRLPVSTTANPSSSFPRLGQPPREPPPAAGSARLKPFPGKRLLEAFSFPAHQQTFRPLSCHPRGRWRRVDDDDYYSSRGE